MRCCHSGKGSQQLHADIREHLAPGQDALGGCCERHGWVNMCPRNRTKNQDQYDQAATSRQTIPEQGNGGITTGEALAHDARADDDCQEKGSPKTFGD
jgi:hypothetical protein